MGLRPPRFPTFAQRVVQIRFADVAQFPFNRSFFLSMAAVDEICAAAPHNSKLPFRKRITAAQPALIQHRFPATIKTCDSITVALNGVSNYLAKLRHGNFIGIEEEEPFG